jgi:LPS-assembly protein
MTEDHVHGERVYITTCDLCQPHYRIAGRQVNVYLGDRVVVKHAFFYIGPIPVAYFPYYSHSLRDDRLRVRIIPGHSREWGYYVLTSWRYFFNEGSKGNVRIDYRERKGWAGGIDHRYDTGRIGEGIASVYYADEENVDARYRAYVRHTWQPDDRTHVMAEYHKISDPMFLRDYFWRDYRRDPKPVSYLSVINRQDRSIFSLYAEKRVNRWMEQVERLPELRHNLGSHKIADFLDGSFFVRSESSIANLNRVFPAPSDRDYSALRIDTYNEISYATPLPGPLDFIHAVPYIGIRQTLYDHADDSFIRGIFYGGWSLSTHFHRIIDKRTDFLNLDAESFRHVVIPRVNFSYIDPTISPLQLPQFDRIDAIDRTHKYTYSLENILQMKRLTCDGLTERVELIYFLAEIDQYLHPMPNQREYSNMRFVLQVNPYNWLTFHSDAEYNLFTGKFDIVNTDIIGRGRDWFLSLGTRYAKDVGTQATLGTHFQISPKWSTGIYQRVSFREDINRFEEQEYRLTRDLHCWLMDIVYNTHRYEGNEILVVFRHKAFPEALGDLLRASYRTRREGHRD